MAATTKFGGNVESCPVCQEKVYPSDRFVIDKLVLHKSCFKCKHCDRKLGLSNFAAVNGMFYCKAHYLKLFRESGGKYDKAFGDGGFEKKTNPSYTPGQFQGIGKTKPSGLPAHLSSNSTHSAPQMSPVVTLNKTKVAEFMKALDEAEDDVVEPPLNKAPELKVSEAKESKKTSSAKPFEAVKRPLSTSNTAQQVQESTVSSKKVSSPNLSGSIETRLKWMSGVSSQHLHRQGEVDRTSGGTIADRRAAFLASLAGDMSDDSPPPPTSSHHFEDEKEKARLITTGNLDSRIKWSENPSTHIHRQAEIDKSPGGTAEERKLAYLSSASNVTPPAASTGSSSEKKKQVSPSISERIRMFSTQSPPSKQKEEVSPGKIDDRLKTFVDAASSSSSTISKFSPIKTEVSIGSIEEKVKTYESSAKGAEINDLLDSEIGHDSEEGRERTNAVVSQTSSKPDSNSGNTIRSFNEGASAGLRRTPSWLLQKRAVDDAFKAMTDAAHAKAEEEPIKPNKEVVETVENPSSINAGNEEEEQEQLGEEANTSSSDEEATPPPKTPPGSIMKRAGSWKKNSQEKLTPPSERVVRFGTAEIHHLPSSPQTPQPNPDDVKGLISGHSARKGSALATYLNMMENGGKSKEKIETAASSPPPPLLSPGTHPPNDQNFELPESAKLVISEMPKSNDS